MSIILCEALEARETRDRQSVGFRRSLLAAAEKHRRVGWAVEVSPKTTRGQRRANNEGRKQNDILFILPLILLFGNCHRAVPITAALLLELKVTKLKKKKFSIWGQKENCAKLICYMQITVFGTFETGFCILCCIMFCNKCRLRSSPLRFMSILGMVLSVPKCAHCYLLPRHCQTNCTYSDLQPFVRHHIATLDLQMLLFYTSPGRAQTLELAPTCQYFTPFFQNHFKYLLCPEGIHDSSGMCMECASLLLL